jgi:hypothetical protein
MKSRVPIAASLLALIAILGCASTKVTDREAYQGRRLARPDRILVHDFAATGADLPEWSEAHDHYAAPSAPRTVAEIATGRELGAQVAAELVADIREMGLPAVRAAGQPAPKLGDIALVGYFESIDEGSAAKRTAIGFGTGAAEMKTQVEGYRVTESGMHRLASAKVESGPGVVVPLVVTIATVNPIGSIMGGAVKAGGERTGKTAIEDTAKQTADAIAEELRTAFKKQGWI